MNDPWSTLEALITVRTYPAPSGQSIEVSCTAGITRDGEWVRLYPVPYRLLEADKQFHKWQWVEIRTRDAKSDPRAESRRIDEESIRILSEPLPTDHEWAARRQIVMPLKAESMCGLQAERDENQRPTLGFVKPRRLRRFWLEPEEAPDWTEAELAKLRTPNMLRQPPARELEKVPVKFMFRWQCESAECGSHRMMCSDWELAELFRRHGENAVHEKIEWMIAERDLHFFVGTLSDYPSRWIIIGLWYPPLVQQGLLV